VLGGAAAGRPLCRLTGGEETYLGRPWRDYARVVYVDCWMGKHIRPEGWHNWRKPHREKTAYYAEYNSKGPGAHPKGRVAWSRQLTQEEAARFTVAEFLKTADGKTDDWLKAILADRRPE
jgi:pectinesterase